MYNCSMKKLLLIILFFGFTASVVVAEDEVYLDLNTFEVNKYDTGEYDYGNKKSEYDTEDDENYLKPSLKLFRDMIKEDFGKEKNADKS